MYFALIPFVNAFMIIDFAFASTHIVMIIERPDGRRSRNGTFTQDSAKNSN